MSDITLEVSHVYKKFKKGEMYDSLRDFMPALAGKLFRIKKDNSLEKNEFWALHDISFKVRKGDAFAIIGPNGSGKSTMLKLLCGVMKPNKGDIKVNGTLSALIEVGAGFHPDLTGRDNIFLNGAILGMKRSEIKRKFDEIVEFSGLGDFIDTPVKRYSSGMYARLGFSVAAHVDPDILIVDEVLSVGDYTFQKKCIQKMNSVIKGGATVIFVSHNMKAVADLCSKSLLLNSGKIVKEGPTDEVVRCYLNQTTSTRIGIEKQEVYISRVMIRSEEGECVRFKSGQKAWIDVEVRATAKCEELAVVLEFRDNRDYEIFNTSTQRMGHGTFSTNPGDMFMFTFELDLHFGSGSYPFGVRIYRSAIGKVYDNWFPAGTIFVADDKDVRGVVNLYPEVKIEKMQIQ